MSEFLVQWNVERLEIIVFTGTWIQMLTPFVDINYFRLLEVRKFILNSKVLFLLPCSLIHCFPPQDLWGPPFVIYRGFFASFDLVDAIENMYMMKISRNSGQDMTHFFADNNGDWYFSQKIGWILVSSPENQYMFLVCHIYVSLLKGSRMSKKR